MRRKIAALWLLAALLTALGIPSARADSPQFRYADAAILPNTGSLQVVFKEVGLGLTAVSESVTLHVSQAMATYQCFNNGGKSPNADNKTLQTSLLITQTFPASNGETTGRFVTGPVRPGTFSCSNGQDLYLVSVSYAFMRVIGSAGDSLPIRPDPIATTLKILVA